MRYLVTLGGLVVSVFVLAAVLLAVMVDPNKYKGEITQLVRERTGRELVFEGDVKLSFFPRLGLRVGVVRLGNPPGFGDKPFTRIQSASVSINILPLLARRVEVGKVTVEGLELHLERDEQGRASWADFTGPEDPRKQAEARKNAAPGPASLTDLSLDGLVLKDARIIWEDRQTGKRYVLGNLNLDVKAIQPGKPFDFAGRCSLTSLSPELSATVELSGTGTLNLGGQRHLLTKFLSKISATGAGVPGGKGDFTLGLAELKIDMARQTAEGGGLSIGAYGATGAGQFQVTSLGSEPDAMGRIEFADFDGRELSDAFRGATPGAVPGSVPGSVPDRAHLPAYQHIRAAFEFRVGRGYTEIPVFTASLDEARLEGHLRLMGIEKKSVNFNVRVEGLDVDRFLPAKKDAAAAGTEKGADKNAAETAAESAIDPATGQPKVDELFQVAALRTLSLDGQITAERVKVKGLHFDTLSLPMTAQNGVLEVGQASARLYGGTLKSTLRVDVLGGQPIVTLHLDLAGVQAGPLFTDLRGKPGELSGLLSLSTSSPLVCHGNTALELKRTVLGRVSFSMADGVFPGVNLLGAVTTVAQKAKQITSGVEPGPEKSTRFGSITGTAVVAGGVVTINDLEVKSPFLRAEGEGTVDLVSKGVDYTIRARLVPSAEGQGGSSGLLGLVVPIRVSGPYDNPTYGTAYMRALGKGALEAVGGLVQGVGNAITGKKGKDGKRTGGLLEGVKKLF